MARTFIGICLAAALAVPIAAGAQEHQARAAGDALIPTCNFPGALCGYVDRDDNTIIAPRFDWADRFHDDRALIRLAGQYGYIDRTGALIIPATYQLAAGFVHGYAEVLVDGKIGLIDIAGNWVVTPRFGRVIPMTASQFLADISPHRSGTLVDRAMSAGLLGGRWGLLQASGQWVLEPKFSHIQFFTRDAGDLFWAEVGKKWQLMRADGHALTDAIFDHVQVLLEDRAVVRVGNKWGAVDGQGRIAVELKFEWLSYAKDGMALFRESGKMGMVDREGRVVIPAVFDRLGRFEGAQTTHATLNGVNGRIDTSGRMISRDDECPDGRKLVRRDGKLQIAGAAGRPINDALFDWVKLVCDAPSVVQLAGDRKWGFVDSSGRLLANRSFDNVHGFHNGLAVVRDGDKAAIIDDSGSFLLGPLKIARGISVSGTGVIRIELDDDNEVVLDRTLVAQLARDPARLAEPLPPRMRCGDGVMARARDGKWGFTDKTGAFFIPPRYDRVACFHRGMAMVAIPERREWCAIDKRGDIVPSIPCQCDQPVMIIEHMRPLAPAPADCYQAGLDLLRRQMLPRG